VHAHGTVRMLGSLKSSQSGILYVQQTDYRTERRLKDRTFAEVLSVTASVCTAKNVLVSEQFSEIINPTVKPTRRTSFSNLFIFA
jgi:hypothetical protein